jgi:Nickel responsive protein SCO4226-like
MKDVETQAQYGVNYKRYWVDETEGKIFCLVEAPDAETAHRVHREAHGLVADEIYEVQEDEWRLRGKLSGSRPSRAAGVNATFSRDIASSRSPAASAYGPSSPLLGESAELLHEAHGVGNAPVLGDLPVLDANDVDRFDLDRLVGRSDAHQFPLWVPVRTARAPSRFPSTMVGSIAFTRMSGKASRFALTKDLAPSRPGG